MDAEDLSMIDFQILEFINKTEPTTLDSIKVKFRSISSIEYRVIQLAKPTYGKSRQPLDNSSFLSEEREKYQDSYGCTKTVGLHIYRLTDLGKKALQDHFENKKRNAREMWLKNAWIPILVSLATNLIVIWSKALLPLIQQWLSSSL